MHANMCMIAYDKSFLSMFVETQIEFNKHYTHGKTHIIIHRLLANNVIEEEVQIKEMSRSMTVP